MAKSQIRVSIYGNIIFATEPEYLIEVPSVALYWINMASAVMDNATLAAAEIGHVLS
jgi:predicted cation transporter